jgi:hypothetical protein
MRTVSCWRVNPSPDQSAETAPRRSISNFLRKLRRLLGNLLQFAQRNQIEELGHETRRLGAATVETATHTGGELRVLGDRVSRIEEELAALRRLLEDQQPGPPGADEPERVASPPSAAG